MFGFFNPFMNKDEDELLAGEEQKIIELRRKQIREEEWNTWKQNRIYDVKVFSTGVLVGVILTTATIMYIKTPLKCFTKQLLLDILQKID